MSEVLYNILINTYNADNVLRSQAEAALKELLKSPGALSALFVFVSNAAVPKDLRVAAGVVIKNKVRWFWGDSDDKPTMPVEEKNSIKSTLIETILIEQDNTVRNLLAETFRVVAEFEYPAGWPGLLERLLGTVQSADVLRMYNALLILRKLTKRFEFKPKDLRGPLNDLIRTTFPYLQSLMTHILSNNTIEAASIMRLCLKIFWSATMYCLPLDAGVNMDAWFEMMANIIHKELPEGSTGLEPVGQPESKDDRRAWPWWKLKKWACRIVCQFIQRYGNPRHCEDEYQEFAEHFKHNTAKLLLSPVMNTLAWKANGHYLTDDVHRMSLTYMAACIEMSPTYKVVKPHLDFLLVNVLFSTLCITPDEITLFNEDPVEFVRKVHNPLEDWLDPRVAATNVLQMLARYRQKDTLPQLMPFLQSTLQEYDAAPTELKNYSKKDGVLVAISSITKILMGQKEYASTLEPFFTAHVVPEFKSPVPYIRSRACWVVDYFCEISWKDPSTLQTTVDGLLLGMRDSALPVQAAAACSLRLLIDMDGAKEMIRPIVKDLVGEYFRIMEEVENDAVLSALQVIVSNFSEEIVPMAPLMVEKLVSSFKQYSADAGEDDEAAFAATECLDTIAVVLEAVKDHPEVLAAVEAPCLPMLYEMLTSTDDCFEYLENCLDLMGYFTYFPEHISTNLWNLCGPLLHVASDWGFDYIGEIATPLLNFISKDSHIFLSGNYNGVTFVDALVALCRKAFTEDESEFMREAKTASVLLTCFISCNKGLLDQIVPSVLELVVGHLEQAKVTGLKTRYLEVVLSIIIYNPVQIMELLRTNEPAAKIIFSSLFANLHNMELAYTQRLIVLSFSGIFASVPTASLPPIVATNMQPMFQQMIRELILIKEDEDESNKRALERADEADDFDDDDFDMGDDDDFDDDDEDDVDALGGERDSAAARRKAALAVPDGGYGEDEDCVNAEDENYRDMLATLDREEIVKRQLYMGGEPVDDEEDDLDLDYTSPTDMIEINAFFISAMEVISQREPETMKSLQGYINEEDKGRLAQIMQFAQEKAAQSVTAAAATP